MSSQIPSSIEQATFAQVAALVRDFSWRPEMAVEEIPAPQRIAPHAIALEADVSERRDHIIGNARLIVLHNPAGVSAWNGTFRCVSLIRADVDIEMVTDPLLAEVGWSWLLDALHDSSAGYHDASGTVTAQSSRSFGDLASEPDRAELEIRASWSPIINQPEEIIPQLRAWQSLACQTAGLAPLPVQITPLINRLEVL